MESDSSNVLARMRNIPGAPTQQATPPVVSQSNDFEMIVTPVWTDNSGVTWMGNIGISSTGLIFPDQELQESEWRAFYEVISKYATAKKLMDGDWYAYGHDHFGYTYAQFAAATGKAESTIESYASVCRNVPQLIRVNSLTFAHYRKVSRLAPEVQDSALKRAAEKHWSVAELGQYLKGAKPRQISRSSSPNTVHQKQYKLVDRKAFNSAKKELPETRQKLAAELRAMADELEQS